MLAVVHFADASQRGLFTVNRIIECGLFHHDNFCDSVDTGIVKCILVRSAKHGFDAGIEIIVARFNRCLLWEAFGLGKRKITWLIT